MIGLAVFDSTCLIGLERIGRLGLLPQLVRSMAVPPAVQAECGFALQGFDVQPPRNTPLVAALRAGLDAGEAEAIALASEVEGATLVLDEKKARRIARSMQLRMIGTIGLLIRAKRAGVLSSCKSVMEDLVEVGFHVSPALYQEALRLAGEELT